MKIPYLLIRHCHSVQRSINLWDFSTIRKGKNKGYISHPLFKQGQRDLARQMKRIRIKGNGERGGILASANGSSSLGLFKDKKGLLGGNQPLLHPNPLHHPSMGIGISPSTMNGINPALLAMNSNQALNMMMMLPQQVQQQQQQQFQQSNHQGYLGQMMGQLPQQQQQSQQGSTTNSSTNLGTAGPAAMQQVLLQIQMQQQMMLMQQQLVMQQMAGTNAAAAAANRNINITNAMAAATTGGDASSLANNFNNNNNNNPSPFTLENSAEEV
jgi:hypothetical protein